MTIDSDPQIGIVTTAGRTYYQPIRPTNVTGAFYR